MRIRHRTNGGRIGQRDWEPTAGGESGYIVADPKNPDIVYGGSYGGFLHDRSTTAPARSATSIRGPTIRWAAGAADIK